MERDLHAAVIGINDYSSGITPLITAAADARAVAAVLEKDHGYTVDLLLDADAGLTGLEDLLEEGLPGRLEEDTALLLYFAGHGVAIGDDVENLRGYLLPHDAKQGDETSWLAMETFRHALDALPCRHLLVVLDCCFGGSFRWAATRNVTAVGTPLYDSQLQRYLKGEAWQVLTSASHNEKALDVLPGQSNPRDADGGAEHSPFAAALLEGLAGNADTARAGYESDGVITATELHQFLFERLVPLEGRAWQTPGLSPLKPESIGEFVFRAPGRDVNTRPNPSLEDGDNPWLGLQAYTSADAERFFGRESVVDALIERLYDTERPSFVVVVGASGTGKSSVVRAGLVPRLRQEGWEVVVLERLRGNPLRLLEQAEKKLDEAVVSAEARPSQLLVIDQFEELYTQCAREHREPFLQELRARIEAGDRSFHVVVTLRNAFEPQLRASPVLGRLVTKVLFPVPAPSAADLRRIVEEPARQKALYFEPPELVGRLVEDVRTMPGALPMLSFALSEMYRQALVRRAAEGADRVLNEADFDAVGGVVGSLHNRASALWEQASLERREMIRWLFLRLVSQEGGRMARRRVSQAERKHVYTEENIHIEAILEEYGNAGLLVIDEDFVVEPAHDTLVMAWDKLLDWLEESRSQDLLRQVWRAAEEWEARADADAETDDGGEAARGLLWTEDPRLPQLADVDGWAQELLARFLPAERRRRERRQERVFTARQELNELERHFVDKSAEVFRRRRNQQATVRAVVIAFFALIAASSWWQTARSESHTSLIKEGEERQAQLEEQHREDIREAELAALERVRRAMDDDVAWYRARVPTFLEFPFSPHGVLQPGVRGAVAPRGEDWRTVLSAGGMSFAAGRAYGAGRVLALGDYSLLVHHENSSTLFLETALAWLRGPLGASKVLIAKEAAFYRTHSVWLKAWLDEWGYTVDYAPDLSAEALESPAIVIIPGLRSELGEELGDEESAALRRFVEGGGGLLVAGGRRGPIGVQKDDYALDRLMAPFELAWYPEQIDFQTIHP